MGLQTVEYHKQWLLLVTMERRLVLYSRVDGEEMSEFFALARLKSMVLRTRMEL